MTPGEMWEICFFRECDRKEVLFDSFRNKGVEMPLRLFGYAETTAPITLGKKSIPMGTTVKAVMFSRFGDFGITDDLTVQNGYVMRMFPTREEQSDPENPLKEIRKVSLTAEDCLTNFRVVEEGGD